MVRCLLCGGFLPGAFDPEPSLSQTHSKTEEVETLNQITRVNVRAQKLKKMNYMTCFCSENVS